MPVTKDATCYNMDHEHRGIAVIINNDIFDAQTLPERKGSWKDVEELEKMFYRLDFNVVVWNNLYHEELTHHLNACMYYCINLFISDFKFNFNTNYFYHFCGTFYSG